jgi:hypothetical protein
VEQEALEEPGHEGQPEDLPSEEPEDERRPRAGNDE